MKYSNIKIFEENSKYLQKMISDITGIDKEILLDNIEIVRKSKQSTKDFIVEFINDDIILKISKNSLMRKTIVNIISLMMGIKKEKKEVLTDLVLVQIHLNYEENCKNKVSRYRIRNITPINQARVCIEISPLLCSVEYKKNKTVDNDIKWGAFFNSAKKDKIKILKSQRKECDKVAQK